MDPSELEAFAQNYQIAGAVPPPPPKPSKGNSFDFASIVVQSEEDFARLPESQKQLLRNMKQGIQYTPQAAAEFVETFNTRLMEQSTPKAQAEASAAQLSARKTQLDIGKLEQETIAKAKEQAELNTRKQLVLEKINKYTNPEAPNYTNISPLVGKFDGTAGAMLDAVGVDEQRSAQRAELERLVNNDVLELTKFLKPVSQDELKFLKSMSPRLHQNDTIWKEYLLDAKSRIEGMGASSSAQPQAAPQAAPPPPPQFRSKEEVIQATNSGQLSREQAAAILRTQFGNQFR
jgi:hypothetical protein